MVFPRMPRGGLFVAHNVINKRNEMRRLPAHHRDPPRSVHDHRRPGRRGRVGVLEAAIESCVRPVHIIGVPLDLGGGTARRGHGAVGVPHRRASASGSHDSGLPGRRPGRPRGADSRDAASRRRQQALRRRHRDGLRTALYDALRPRSTDGGAAARARRRPQPRRRVGGGDGGWARERGGTIGLIWVDAHGDMNTPASTTSGNVHGMPLAALLGSEPAELAGDRRVSPRRSIPSTRVLIGVRNLDDREKQRVRESRIHVFTMKDIDRAGIAAVIEQAIRAGRPRHGRHPRLVRSRRLRSVHRARRRHAGQGRPRLPRGAHGDGDAGRLGPAASRSTWSK